MSEDTGALREARTASGSGSGSVGAQAAAAARSVARAAVWRSGLRRRTNEGIIIRESETDLNSDTSDGEGLSPYCRQGALQSPAPYHHSTPTRPRVLKRGGARMITISRQRAGKGFLILRRVPSLAGPRPSSQVPRPGAMTVR